MGTTEKVAKFVVDFDYKQIIPPKGIENIKIDILDSIGTTLFGNKQPIGAMMFDFVKETGGKPQTRLIGNGLKTSTLNAALYNGTVSASYDFDGVGSFGHDAVVLMPIALGMGEELKLSGKQIMAAYAAAFEVGFKLAAVLGDISQEEESGIHQTALLGPLVGAVMASKLLGLDMAKTRDAIGISASCNSGLLQSFGYYAKALHAGHASRTGIMSAVLAGKGFTGDPNVLEERRGFFYAYGGPHAQIRKMTEELGKNLAIVEPGVHIKPTPGHSAAPAAPIMRLVAKYGVKSQDVESIEVVSSGMVPGLDFRDDPDSGFQGLFSWPYCMAVALVDGKVDVQSFTDEKLNRPEVKRLIKSVKRYQHPELVNVPRKLEGGKDFGTRVTLKLKDGRELVDQSSGGGLGGSLKGEAIYDKFRSNARLGGFSKAKAEQVIQVVENLENIKDMTEIVDAVSG